MKIPVCTGIDFETKGIEARPDYPPEPVGVSIRFGGRSRYYAWGHKNGGNNCTKADAAKALRKVWGNILLFHNAKFDIDVAMEHFGLPHPKPGMYHDTLFLVFLADPHADELGLKPAAERLLGMAPEERDAVAEWIYENIPDARARGNKGKLKKDWGEYIWECPGDIVAPYANGDNDRAAGLFKKLYPQICADGMQRAYERELLLIPMFLENERIGIRVDLKALRRDVPMYRKELEKADAWLRKRLKTPNLNIDSDRELAEALDKCGVVTDWVLTKTGQRSVAKKNLLPSMYRDRNVFLVLGYRNRLTTCLGTFMENWLRLAERTGGTVHGNWNQVRQMKTGEDDTKGTRTGRPSCNDPNYLAIAKAWEDKGDDWTHPKVKGLKLEPLPLVRKYLLPDEGCVWLHRDYNQQELRLLAHFEDGKLKEAYIQNPKLDVHTHVQGEVHVISGKLWPRSPIKNTVFGKIYGQGVPSLAEKMRLSEQEVKEVRNAVNKALPGLPDLENEIKRMGQRGEPIVTWGGRIYYCEPAKFVEKFGRVMTFEYKLLNYLIQGSAADCTKEALIRWYYDKKRDKRWRFLVTVYDEINICAPVKDKKPAMLHLQKHMESIETDVPMLSDGKWGKSWGTLEKAA